jgi:tetratricopeptide (TPR) repeat protein
MVELLFRLDVLDKKYEEALTRLPLESSEPDGLSIADTLRYAQIYGFKKETELAEKYYNDARSILESKVKEDPNHAWYHSKLGIAYAGLGRTDKAIQQGQMGVRLLRSRKGNERNPNPARDMAKIYVMVGKYDLAIKQLNFVLSVPSNISIPLLQLDPAWAPLLDHPRFQKLIDSDK